MIITIQTTKANKKKRKTANIRGDYRVKKEWILFFPYRGCNNDFGRN